MTTWLFWLLLLSNKLPHGFCASGIQKGLSQEGGFLLQSVRQQLESPASSVVSGAEMGRPDIFSFYSCVFRFLHLLSPCGLVVLPHSMVVLGQLGCVHGSSGLQYSRNEAEAACLFPPRLRNHAELHLPRSLGYNQIKSLLKFKERG